MMKFDQLAAEVLFNNIYAETVISWKNEDNTITPDALPTCIDPP